MIRKSVFSVFFLFCSLFLFAQSSNFTLQPEKPQPGEVVKITYTPPAGFVSGSEPLRCDAYKFGMYDEQMTHGAKPLKCQLVKLTKTGTTYTGEVKTDPETRFLAFSFTIGRLKYKGVSGKAVLVSGKADLNNKNGYSTLLYDANGKALNLSALFAGWYYTGNFYNSLMFSNSKLAVQYYEQQIALDSTFRDICKQREVQVLHSEKPDESRKIAQTELNRQFAKGFNTEDDYFTTSLFPFAGISNARKYFDKIAREKFANANGRYQALRMGDEVWNEKDADKQAVAVKNIEAFYDRADWKTRFYCFAASNIAKEAFYTMHLTTLAQAGRMGEVIDAVKRQNYFAYYYGGYINWKGLVKPLLEKSNPQLPDLIAAQEKYVKPRWESLKKDPEQPSATPEEDCQTTANRYQEVTSRYANLQYLYARYYFNTSAFDKGYPYIKTAYKLSKEIDFQSYDAYDINDLYLKYTDKFAPKESKALIESFVKDDCFSDQIKEALKKIYVAEKGSDTGFDSYFAALNNTNTSKIDVKEVVKSLLVNIPAPAFTLQDVSGNTVSLESLKGKTVILDFWATWCGPCLASFPAMLKLKEKYAANSDVTIIFVNTWERNVKSSGELKQRITDFLKAKKFDINPLLDEKGAVVDDFGIQSIPTKVVIDKNGNIRYKISGAETDQNKLLEEMNIMIESVK
jgi:thiol-disulfide isomerase/thioredoxin